MTAWSCFRRAARIWLTPALCFVAPTLHAAAVTPPAESPAPPALLEKLDAIRGALVDAALGKEARVSSVLWIDESGQLHENTRVTSDLRVRAIRVQPATKATIATPHVAIDAMPSSSQKQDCRTASPDLRLPLIIETDYQPGGVLVSNQITLGQIATLLENLIIQQQAGNSRWDTKAAQRSVSYSQWVTAGYIQTAPYRLKLTLGVAPANTPPGRRLPLLEDALSAFGKHEPPPFALQAVLVENQSGRVHWHDAFTLPGFGEVPKMTRPEPPAAWTAAVSQTTGKILNDAFQAIRCNAAFFDVLKLDQKAFAVNAGKKSGLRTGDQMLIAPPGLLPARLLEKGGVERTFIGEVEEVFSDYSKIRIFGTSALPNEAANMIAYPL